MELYPLKFIESTTGEKIAYRESGSGETVLLLHGNMSSSVHWTKTMEVLEKEYHVFAPDLRGFGDSSYRKKARVLRTYGRDIIAFMEALDLKDVHLVGWSAGGGVAMEVAASNLGRKRVKDLIILSGVGVQGTQDLKKNILKHFPRMNHQFGMSGIKIPNIDPFTTIRSPFKKIQSNVSQEWNKYLVQGMWKYTIYNLNMPPKDEFDANIKATMKQRNLKDILQALQTFNITDEGGEHPGTGRIHKLDLPIMWIHGEKDLVIPVDDAKFSRNFFPNKIHLKIFKHAGHSIMTDNLEVLTQLMKDFFKGII
ncbi:MAG: alpha/beta hydrolase [Tissierellia bacterium]|nr:alpha/beta hydrolase [Tissierellia bacterium]